MTSIFSRKSIFFTSILVAATMLFTACEKAVEGVTAVQLDQQFVALTKDLMLQTYNASNISSPMKSVQVTGLQSAESILGIDYRPATGQLYALGNTSRIYVINTNTGVATALGTGTFTPLLSGIVAGFDFNPTVDRIRIVTTTGQNLRVNPETGAVQNVDGTINGGTNPMISGAAYTNPVAGAATTVLYDIDVTNKKLYKQDPPNNGTLVEVGNLTIANAMGEASFDIASNGTALAATSDGTTSTLYQVDISNGAATSLGTFGGAMIIGLAIPTAPVAYAVDLTANLVIFNPTTNDQVIKQITGLQANDTIVGIDFRPANGQLYALGNGSRLYTINLATGAATQVGSAQLTPMLTGTSFGFDFNPTVDRIRVVSNSGQNLRLDPNTGLVAVTDAMLNPGTPAVSAAAYTNNFAGATTTAHWLK